MTKLIIPFLALFLGLFLVIACTDIATKSKEVSSVDEIIPLASWNEGTTKNNIISYIEDVTKPGGQNFIPVEDRIATFDNDGTLWSEKPYYFQTYFMRESVKAEAPGNPDLQAVKYVKEILNDDEETIGNLSPRDILKIIVACYNRKTITEYEERVNAWIENDTHPELGVAFTELIYQPMLELMDYLRAHQFKVFIVSGGGMDFVRPWSYEVYGVPRNAVMGSSVVTKFHNFNENPVIRRTLRVDFVDDKEGKPVGIHKLIGKKPVFACGNSDGDLEMMQWTDSNTLPSFQLYLHHTDAEREWEYAAGSNTGALEEGLEEAQEKGWTVIDMKNDWNKVFPKFEKE